MILLVNGFERKKRTLREKKELLGKKGKGSPVLALLLPNKS
jgi:hypothetical protein